MVWQYTEYEGTPYLTDYVKGKFKFGIENQGKVMGARTLQVKLPSGEVLEALEYQTNQHLLPFFHMSVGSNKKSNLNLKLVEDGLVRELWTPQSSGQLDYRPLGYGRFSDFKLIGKYAAERLPRIAAEIVLPPERFPEDVPQSEVQEINEFRRNCLAVASWEKTQADILYHFFNYFIVSMVAEVTHGGRLRRKRKPFSKEQQRELKQLIEPLNPYKE